MLNNHEYPLVREDITTSFKTYLENYIFKQTFIPLPHRYG